MAIQTTSALQSLKDGAKNPSPTNSRGTRTDSRTAYERGKQATRVAPIVAEKPVVTPVYSTSSTGSGSAGASDATDYYQQLYDMFAEENAKARDQMLKAIELQLEATKGAYNQSMRNTSDEYDKLIDQNEVKKARARRIMKENQANLGILNGGLGRQEQLDLNVGYDANTVGLHKAKQQAIDEITNLITQAEAEAENNRANVNNTYSNALMQWRLANL